MEKKPTTPVAPEEKIVMKLIEIQLGAAEILRTFSEEPEYVKRIPEWIKHIHECISDIAKDIQCLPRTPSKTEPTDD